MQRWRWFGGIILIFALKFLLLDYSAVPRESNFEIDIKKIRKLAKQYEGDFPESLSIIQTATSSISEALLFTGGSFSQKRLLGFNSFRLNYKNKSYIIDTAHTKERHAKEFPDEDYSLTSYKLAQDALLHSTHIFFTHRHWDHMEGAVKSPYFAKLRSKFILTPEQVEGPSFAKTEIAKEDLDRISVLRYEQYYRFAPGFVLIKAPGHTIGTQMFYMQLKNGKEYLLVGCIAWNSKNIEDLKPRPMLTSMYIKENRELVYQQLRAIHDLQKQENIEIIYAHDYNKIQEQIRDSLLVEIKNHTL